MSVLDGERYLAKLDDHETRLVRAILGLRGLLVAGIAVGLLSERRGWDSRATAVAVLACWALIASLLTLHWSAERHRLAPLLASDQVVWAGFTGFGFGWRAASFFAAAAPVIIATIKITVRWALALTGLAIIIAAVWFGLEPISGTDPARTAEWIPAQAGLIIAVALFSYLRYLLHGLRAATEAYQADVAHRSDQLHRSAQQEHRAALTRSFQVILQDRIAQIYVALAHVPTSVGSQARDDDFGAVLDMLAEARTAVAKLAGIEDPMEPGDQADMTARLEAIAANAERRFGIPIALRVEGDRSDTWSDQRRATVARFYDEAITNACKHGRPPIGASFHQRDGLVEIAVTDAGEGFEPAKESPGRGLQALRNAAAALGSELLVTATPGLVSVGLIFAQEEPSG